MGRFQIAENPVNYVFLLLRRLLSKREFNLNDHVNIIRFDLFSQETAVNPDFGNDIMPNDFRRYPFQTIHNERPPLRRWECADTQLSDAIEWHRVKSGRQEVWKFLFVRPRHACRLGVSNNARQPIYPDRLSANGRLRSKARFGKHDY